MSLRKALTVVSEQAEEITPESLAAWLEVYLREVRRQQLAQQPPSPPAPEPL